MITKWALIYGADARSPKLTPFTGQDFNELINLHHELNGAVKLPSQYPNLFLFLRNVAFQQFWLQEQFTLPRFARQSILFGTLDANHTFQTEFFARTGIHIRDFLRLSIVLMTRFASGHGSQPYVTVGWFQPLESKYSATTIRTFLYALSSDLHHLRDSVRKAFQKHSTNIDYVFYEQTPLWKYPLLRVEVSQEERFFCFSPNLLFHCLQTYIYDVLRDADASLFMDKFGQIFERYIKSGLEYAQLRFITEEIIQKHLGREIKSVDFLVVENNSNIFIDAKGVEIAYLGMVSDNPDVIVGKTKSSILKGIKQGYSLARELKSKDRIGDFLLGKGQNYLIVVTFKDFYVGNGRDFREHIAPTEVDRIIAEIGEQIIPLENIYFLSVDDLELLLECSKRSGLNITEIIQSAIEADRNPQTSKFVFRQHVRAICPKPELPQYLTDDLDRIMADLKQLLE